MAKTNNQNPEGDRQVGGQNDYNPCNTDPAPYVNETIPSAGSRSDYEVPKTPSRDTDDNGVPATRTPLKPL